MLVGGVAFGGLLLTSCALPGTSAPAVGNIGTVHVAGAPAVEAPPAIVVSPSNAAQGIALDAPIMVTVSTGHLDTVSLSEAGSSTPLPGAMSPDGRSWQMNQPLDQARTTRWLRPRPARPAPHRPRPRLSSPPRRAAGCSPA